MSSDTKAVGAEPKTELDVVPTVSHGEPHDAATAINNERQMSVRDSFRFWPKAIAFSFVISLAIIMEGIFYPFELHSELTGACLGRYSTWWPRGMLHVLARQTPVLVRQP